LAKFHEIEVEHVVEHKVYAKKGRPGPDAEFTTVYQAEYKIVEDQDAVEARAQQGSCYVLATTVPEKELSDREVVAAYKGQNSSVERGFRFLKDPIFFTSSLYVKSPKRVMGLLMVMTLALLVYSIAQRNMRRYLEEYGKTLPNQIKKEIVNPTLRWIFQIMEGITIVRVSVEGKLTSTFSGITDLHLRILECFPPSVQQIYGLAA
jgi:transposase